MIWTDSVTGLQWEIIDYVGGRGQRKRVDLGSWKAEGRAFVPVGREGSVMLYNFGLVPQRGIDNRNLTDSLAFAKPSQASPGDRMQRNDVIGEI